MSEDTMTAPTAPETQAPEAEKKERRKPMTPMDRACSAARIVGKVIHSQSGRHGVLKCQEMALSLVGSGAPTSHRSFRTRLTSMDRKLHATRTSVSEEHRAIARTHVFMLGDYSTKCQMKEVQDLWAAIARHVIGGINSAQYASSKDKKTGD